MSARRTVKKAPPRGEVVPLREQEPRSALPGPGAHFAKLFRKIAEGQYEAQLFAGGRIEVGVAPEVDLELVDRCLAEQEIVLVGALGEGVVVFGALKTKVKKGEDLVIEAPRRVVLRAGRSKIELRADGKVKLSGDTVTVDAPSEVRLASAHVEIP